MRQFFRSPGHDSALWPVLLLLLIVLVPSAGVVWMMRAAMENERLAVRQRLADAYHAQLDFAKRRIDGHWQQRIESLEAIVAEYPPRRTFAECVRAGLADSVVLLDDEGRAIYPAPTSNATTAEELFDESWHRAERLEFVENDPAAAAAAYQQIATDSTDASVATRARQARARALVRAGDRRGAVAVLQELSGDDHAVDSLGRSLAADAELRLLELLDADSPERQAIATRLAERLNNYDAPLPPPEQRRFLMWALHSLLPSVPLPTIAAEDLAAAFLAEPTEPIPPSALQPAPIRDVWQIRSPSGRATALYRLATLQQSIEAALAEQPFPAGVNVAIRRPANSQGTSDELAGVSLAPTMPGWRLSLSPADAQSFDAAANERVAFFLWTAVVVVAITASLALLVANVMRRQSRLTRLKNDLVATVSHELKTPLASIRLLVDTLLDADGSPEAPFGDRARAREYLEMIAQENTRLSRLIDNFLTFSRMERGKHRFDFQPTDAVTIVDQAVAAVADRFDTDKNQLGVDVERPLPLVGDVDALITVVVNLLDNAWKYSDEPKRIRVTARRVADTILISVADNGIGLSPRAVRRVFDRFYQVDQRLSRGHSGCGLGLSIVKYIVEAHGGRVTVESRLGEGTTFTMSLPADVPTHVEENPR